MNPSQDMMSLIEYTVWIEIKVDFLYSCLANLGQWEPDQDGTSKGILELFK